MCFYQRFPETPEIDYVTPRRQPSGRGGQNTETCDLKHSQKSFFIIETYFMGRFSYKIQWSPPFVRQEA